MQREGWFEVAVVSAVLFMGCTMSGPEAGTPPAAEKPERSVTVEKVAEAAPKAGQEIVLETETFTLKDCKVVDLKGASGGKAIFFETDSGTATLTVTLKKGTYEVTAYCQGVDEDQDAFYVTVGTYEERLFPDEYGKVVAAKPFRVVVGQDGACKVVISAAEANVHVDRLVLKPVQ